MRVLKTNKDKYYFLKLSEKAHMSSRTTVSFGCPINVPSNLKKGLFATQVGWRIV